MRHSDFYLEPTTGYVREDTKSIGFSISNVIVIVVKTRYGFQTDDEP